MAEGKLRKLRMGEVFWLINCPALDDEGTKTRPVVILTPNHSVENELEPFIVVACTTRFSPNHLDAILLPNAATHPQTTSGLSRATWAIPKWYLPTTRQRLGRCIGSISGSTLKKVVLAVEARMGESS